MNAASTAKSTQKSTLEMTSAVGVWLLCGAVAFQRIRARQIQSHRAWMVRTFALTFAAVTLRLWMVVFQIAGLDYIESYIAVAWLSWVPNLVVAEWIVHRITRNPADARLGHGASRASA